MGFKVFSNSFWDLQFHPGTEQHPEDLFLLEIKKKQKSIIHQINSINYSNIIIIVLNYEVF